MEQWDNKEIKFILANYLDMTAKEIADKLNRSVDSVKHKRRQLVKQIKQILIKRKEKILVDRLEKMERFSCTKF